MVFVDLGNTIDRNGVTERDVHESINKAPIAQHAQQRMEVCNIHIRNQSETFQLERNGSAIVLL